MLFLEKKVYREEETTCKPGAALVEWNPNLSEEENILVAFDKLDVNRTGKLMKIQLREALMKANPDLRSTFIDGIILASDENKDGKIDLAEFTTLVRSTVSRI